jgi:hypothetical protein
MDDTTAALSAPFNPPPSAKTLLVDAWQWCDRTEDMADAGFPAHSTRYVEVAHDRGYSLICIDETGAQLWSGVEIDWLDVVAADVAGARRYEATGADGEPNLFPRAA